MVYTTVVNEPVTRTIKPSDVYSRYAKERIAELLKRRNLKIVGFRPVKDNETGIQDCGYELACGAFWSPCVLTTKAGIAGERAPRFIVESNTPIDSLEAAWE